MDVAERVAGSLLSGGRVKRPYLGIGTQPVPLPEAVRGKANQESGLLVLAVEPKSPADQAGLMQGDTLIGIDGTSTTDLDALYTSLRRLQVGSTQKVRIVRAGELKELSITVGEQSR